MRVYDCNWMVLERYLERDDRIVLPVGSTEQHAYLSLGTDNILAERVSLEAAEPLGIPVLPALPYGVTPSFAAWPGSPSLSEQTFLAVVGELLDSLRGQGFRRIMLVNGHGGNEPAARFVASDVIWHSWYAGPKVSAVVERLGLPATHASWVENFPWTRLPGVVLPAESKPAVPPHGDDPAEVRQAVGDGNYGGPYQVPDDAMAEVWAAGVEEVRELLESGWSV